MKIWGYSVFDAVGQLKSSEQLACMVGNTGL